MTAPAPYVVGYSFVGYQATNPRTPLPAAQVDAELANIATAIGETQVALADVRRSDGALPERIVTFEALSNELRVQYTGGQIDAWAPVVTWATGLVCVVNAPTTIVSHLGSTYICTTAHTAGASFDSSKWATLASKGDSGPGTGDLLAANNLSDVVDAGDARTNLGLGNVDNTADASKPISTLTQAALDAITAALPATGDFKQVAYLGTAQTGWIDADGAAISRTTYAALFAKLVTAAGFTAQTFTVTIASPGVVTKTAHGFVGGERLRLSTTGALPTGLNITTDYFVERINANTFYLLDAKRGGTRVVTTGAQSGTHSYVRSLWGLGDGSTTFNAPDLRDEYVRGYSSTRPLGVCEDSQNRAHTHTGTTDNEPNHTHGYGVTHEGRENGGLDTAKNAGGGASEDDTDPAGAHDHPFTTDSQGGTEVRVNATFVRWLVKT
jgi:microcystin-dependent protein